MEKSQTPRGFEPKYNRRLCGCLTDALKLRVQGRWTTVRARQGTNTPLPLKRSPPARKRSPPASFKRLLGGGPHILTSRHCRRARPPCRGEACPAPERDGSRGRDRRECTDLPRAA